MPKSRFTLRFSEPPDDLRLIRHSIHSQPVSVDLTESNPHSPTTRSPSARIQASSPTRCKEPFLIDSASPVFQDPQPRSETAQFVFAHALKPNDRVEFIYSIVRLEPILEHDFATLDTSCFPIDMVVSRMTVVEPTPPKKRKLTKPQKEANNSSPEVICLDDSDDEEKQEVYEIESADDDTYASVTDTPPDSRAVFQAVPDPYAAFGAEDWVLTSMGPGLVLSARIDRHATSPCCPLVVYQIELEWGSVLYTHLVEALEQSDLGRELLVKEPRVVRYDLVWLWPGVYLNDSIIAFYIHHLKHTYACDQTYIYSTYFYSKIALHPRTMREELWESLKGWTKNVENIWNKHLLLVPIHDRHHWSLAVIVNPSALQHQQSSKACILHLDSGKRFQLHRSSTVYTRMRKYLRAVMGDVLVNKSTLPGFAPPVPQQDNETDCGVFMLEFLERLVQLVGEDELAIPDGDSKEAFPPFATDWFDGSLIACKRQSIERLIQEKARSKDP